MHLNETQFGASYGPNDLRPRKWAAHECKRLEIAGASIEKKTTWAGGDDSCMSRNENQGFKSSSRSTTPLASTTLTLFLKQNATLSKNRDLTSETGDPRKGVEDPTVDQLV